MLPANSTLADVALGHDNDVRLPSRIPESWDYQGRNFSQAEVTDDKDVQIAVGRFLTRRH